MQAVGVSFLGGRGFVLEGEDLCAVFGGIEQTVGEGTGIFDFGGALEIGGVGVCVLLGGEVEVCDVNIHPDAGRDESISLVLLGAGLLGGHGVAEFCFGSVSLVNCVYRKCVKLERVKGL